MDSDRFPLISFWLGLSVAATWISQSLMDFAFACAVLSWIYYAYKNRLPLKPNSRLKVIIPLSLAYFATAAIGYVVNGRAGAEPYFNLIRFFWIIQFVFLTYIVRHISFNHRKQWIVNYGFLFVPAIYGLNVLFTEGNIDLITKQFASGRVVGLVNSATYHAHIAGFFIILSLALAIFQFTRKKKDTVWNSLPITLILSGLIIFSVSLYYTKTRGALLALTLSLFFFAFLYLKKRVQKLLVVLFAVAIVFAGVKVLSMQERAQSDRCRIVLLQVHYEIFKKFPILGMGYRDNMRNLSDYWPSELDFPECNSFKTDGSQAHNQYLNVAATTGSIGLVLFLALIFYFLYLNWNWWKQEDSLLALTCLILQTYFLLSCVTEITFEFAKIRYLILVVWAVVVNNEMFVKTQNH